MNDEILLSTLDLIKRLESLLTEEFEALKSQNLDLFELLQTEKINLLQKLAALDIVQDSSGPLSIKEIANHPRWNEIITTLENCKRSHQRNELLISKQLDAIRGALSALQDQDPSSTIELYTKLGKTRATRRSILSGDA